jgi:hypothetical protein
MNTKPLLIATAIAAAFAVGPIALAQDTGSDAGTTTGTTTGSTTGSAAGSTAGTTADAAADAAALASVPPESLAERFADLAGSTDAASQVVAGLRSGGDFSITRDVETVQPDGSIVIETVETAVANANDAMGFGEINNALTLADALVESGAFADVGAALGDPDGILQLRADGLGWGEIAQELGFNLGALVSAHAGPAGTGAVRAGLDEAAGVAVDAAGTGLGIAADAAGTRAGVAAGSATAVDARLQAGAGRDVAADARVNARIDAGARADGAGRPASVGRPLLPERPVSLDRPTAIDLPVSIERPQRPERPQRGGGR